MIVLLFAQLYQPLAGCHTTGRTLQLQITVFVTNPIHRIVVTSFGREQIAVVYQIQTTTAIR